MNAPHTLLSLLERALERDAPDLGYHFLPSGCDLDTTEALTFAALARRAMALGAWLRDRVEPGDRVVLLHPPGLDFLVSFFGCLCAPCVAVPVYPPEPSRIARTLPRLERIAADCGARLVLTSTRAATALRRMAADAAPQLAALPWLDVQDAPADAPWAPPSLRPDALAFLQYTSGSTRAPRGVMIGHDNLLANLALIHKAFDNGPDSHAVNWLPLYHDMGLIGAILQPLYAGHPATFMSPMTFLVRPAAWLQTISRVGGTHCGGPDFGYHLCTRRVRDSDLDGVDLSRWRVAFNGAEPIRAPTLRRFTERFAPWGFSPAAHFPCYGLAEATLFASGGPLSAPPRHLRVDPDASAKGRVVPTERGRTLVSSGRIHPELEVRVVDPDTHRPRDPMEVGEIWLRGPSVAHGYWGNPTASARTFGALLDGAGDDAPWLRTGDLGFVWEGELFVMGRLKDVIIVRGRNHYPQDIEATATASHPMLRTGCAAAFSLDAREGERLALALEVRDGGDKEADAIIAAVRQAVSTEHELTLHAVALLPARTIPKTSSGKLKRHACRRGLLRGTLPLLTRRTFAAPTFAALPTRAELLAAPPDRRAARLTEALQEALAQRLDLPAEALRPAAPLNQHGLDSLDAMELQQRLEEALALPIPLSDLLDGPPLAALVTSWLAALTDAPAPPPLLVATDLDGPLPLSWQQERSWAFDRALERGAFRFHVSGAYRLDGRFDPDALRRSLDALTRRHSALRTRFIERGGQPAQRVVPGARVEPTVIDARDLSPDARRRRLEAVAAQQANAPFDLGEAPLARVSVVRESEERSVVLVTLHHIVADATSLALFTRELTRLYDAHLRGVPAELPPNPLQFVDVIRWQRRALSPQLAEDLAHWRRRLADAPTATLLSNPATDADSGHAVLSLAPSQLKALRRLGRDHGSTLFMTLLAACQATLHRWTGEDDLLLDAVFANRTRPELHSALGFIAENLVLRADLGGDPTFAELLDRSRAGILEAWERRAWRSLFATEPGLRDLALSPLCVNMQPPQVGEPCASPAARLTPLPELTRALMTHCLGAILYIFTEGDALHIDLVHNRAFLADRAARRALRHLDRALAIAVERPTVALSELTAL